MAENYDLDAIAADEALLDLLAAGGEAAFEALEAGGSDPAIQLLTTLRLAVEVEDELPVEHIEDAETFLARCAALNPVVDPLARKIAARTLALGVAAVAALSVSGVAAAVTGDPLAPYENVIKKVVDGFMPEITFPADDLEGLPVNDKVRITKVAKDYKVKRTEELRREKSDQLIDGSMLPPALTDKLKPPFARTTLPPLVAGKDEDKTLADDKVTPPLVNPTTEATKPPESKPSAQPTVVPTVAPSVAPTTTTTPPPPTTETPPPTTETPPPVDPTPTPTSSVPPTETGENGGGDPQPGTGGTTTVPTVPPGGGNGQQGEDGGPGGDPVVPSTPVETTTPADKGETGDKGESGEPGDKGEPEGTGGGLGDQVGELVDGLPILGDGTLPATSNGGRSASAHKPIAGQSGFTPAVLRQILAMLNGVMVSR